MGSSLSVPYILFYNFRTENSRTESNFVEKARKKAARYVRRIGVVWYAGGVYGFLDGNRGFFWGYAVREAGDYAFLSYLCLQPLQVMVTRPVPLGTQAMRWHLGQRK